MKKIFALFLILAIVVLSFASCGRDGNLAYDEVYNDGNSKIETFIVIDKDTLQNTYYNNETSLKK